MTEPIEVGWAKCQVCEQHMQPGGSCGIAEWDGGYKRVPHDGQSNCRDCNVKPGGVHHYRCCVERCSGCKVRQAMTCGCVEGN